MKSYCLYLFDEVEQEEGDIVMRPEPIKFKAKTPLKANMVASNICKSEGADFTAHRPVGGTYKDFVISTANAESVIIAGLLATSGPTWPD